ncbi:MAG: DUF1684 domain-containing protein [Pseudorhodobacter sp.]|nr:DUF1684 domain-containing protein [Pseudorhodobacter sp.]
MTSDYEARLQALRAARLAELSADDGWLNLTDRVELQPGSATLGSAAGNDIVLSAGPAHLGTLTLEASGAARLRPDGGAELAFQPVPEKPPRLVAGGLLLEIHSVEGKPALRVRDLAPERRAFAGLRYFPTDPGWCIRADWVALKAPQRLAVDMVNGASEGVTQTHSAEFVHNGVQVALVPTHAKAGRPMFVFRDLTSRDLTYAASRFLYGTEIAGGKITLDFNTAFNPPCAFTDYAICPLPPRANILPFRIEAGELRP